MKLTKFKNQWLQLNERKYKKINQYFKLISKEVNK